MDELRAQAKSRLGDLQMDLLEAQSKAKSADKHRLRVRQLQEELEESKRKTEDARNKARELHAQLKKSGGGSSSSKSKSSDEKGTKAVLAALFSTLTAQIDDNDLLDGKQAKEIIKKAMKEATAR